MVDDLTVGAESNDQLTPADIRRHYWCHTSSSVTMSCYLIHLVRQTVTSCNRCVCGLGQQLAGHAYAATPLVECV